MKKANLVIVKKRKVPVQTWIAALAVSATLLAWTNRKEPAKPVTTVTVVAPAIAKAVAPAAVPASRIDNLTEVAKKIRNQKIAGLESLEREKSSKALRITLSSDVFFQLGTAKLEEGSKESIQQIISILKPLSTVSAIEIEGHTDGSPVVRQKPNYPSNWELSAARAASLIPLFANSGFFKDQLKVIGYGDSRPVVSNRMEKKVSAKNRRIVLRVLTQEEEARI